MSSQAAIFVEGISGAVSMDHWTVITNGSRKAEALTAKGVCRRLVTRPRSI